MSIFFINPPLCKKDLIIKTDDSFLGSVFTEVYSKEALSAQKSSVFVQKTLCMHKRISVYVQVKWRPVIWGFLLQFIFAVVILRTTWGYDAFNFLGDRIKEFLVYTDAGSIFVFGELYTNHFFAFKVG